MPTPATPATCGCAPGPSGAAVGTQVEPPSPLSQAAPAWTVTVRLGLPVTSVVTTSPAIRISLPATATYLTFRARPPPAARCSRAASSRCQVIPLAEAKISGVDLAWLPPGTFAPTAMKPAAVRARPLIWSPGSSGSPLPGASVHVRPSALVQIEPGPSATQAPWAPATKTAPCPGGGTPPPADRTVPNVHERPSLPDTKNWARAMRAPACDPTATISSPTLVIRPSVALIPRPLTAAVKSLPARVAGGKPRAVADGAGPALPLFAPAITTTATPKTTIARIGIATLTPQPRKSRPARNSRDHWRLGGWGSSERSSPAHSAPAALRSGRAADAPRRRRTRAGLAGEGDDAGRDDVLRLVIEFESGRGELVVIGPRLRRRRQRLAYRRGVPETPRLARRVLGPRVLGAWVGWVGWDRLGPRPGRRRRPSNSNPGAVPLQGSRPAGGWGRCWHAEAGAARGTRGAPGAVSLGIAGRFPCHLCLTIFRMPPAESAESGGINLENPDAISRRCYRPGSDATGTFAHVVAGSGPERPRACRE